MFGTEVLILVGQGFSSSGEVAIPLYLERRGAG